MANEVTIRNYPKDYLATDFTWDNDAVGGEKGTILKISGARTVAASAADNDQIAGVLAREKIANDGRTQVAVWRSGIFDCVVQGGCVTGDDLTISGANILKKYTTLDDEKGYVFGKALETSTDPSSTIQVQVNLD